MRRPLLTCLALLLGACGQVVVVDAPPGEGNLPENQTILPPGGQDPTDPDQSPNDQSPDDQNPDDQNPDPGDDDPVDPDPADDTPDELPPEDVLPPEAQSCQVWQDCAPHFGDLNSGLECQSNQCVCDPVGQWASACASAGAFWIAEECYCQFASEPPPSSAPSENCWWHWYTTGCEPDRWVDTSHYEDYCYYDSFEDRTVCEPEWVESGYWEPGECDQGYWIEYCR